MTRMTKAIITQTMMPAKNLSSTMKIRLRIVAMTSPLMKHNQDTEYKAYITLEINKHKQVFVQQATKLTICMNKLQE